MTLRIQEMPDDPQLLAPWLERELVGLSLNELVAELLAIGAQAGIAPPVEEVPEELLAQVLEGGLVAVPVDRLRVLLWNPRLLLELQRQIAMSGGTYWNSVPRPAELHRQVAQSWSSLDGAFLQQYPPVESAKPPGSPAVSFRSPRGRADMRRSVLIGVLGIAGVIGVLWLGLSGRLVGDSDPWGFESPGLFAQQQNAKDYLRGLAEAADEWFQQRRDSAEELERRLHEFDRGCERLLAASHDPLLPQDREWLMDRCRAWRARVQEHLADLRSARLRWQQVGTDADETMTRLVRALRDRSPA